MESIYQVLKKLHAMVWGIFSFAFAVSGYNERRNL